MSYIIGLRAVGTVGIERASVGVRRRKYAGQIYSTVLSIQCGPHETSVCAIYRCTFVKEQLRSLRACLGAHLHLKGGTSADERSGTSQDALVDEAACGFEGRAGRLLWRKNAHPKRAARRADVREDGRC